MCMAEFSNVHGRVLKCVNNMGIHSFEISSKRNPGNTVCSPFNLLLYEDSVIAFP